MRVKLAGLAQAAAVITAACSVVALLPVDHFAVQLFVHFKWQYFAASAILLLAFIALRQPRHALAMLIAAALNASFVLPWHLDEPRPVDGERLKLVLANLLADNGEHERLLAFIDDEQPDIVVLLEVTPSWAKSLRRLGDAYPFRIVEARDHRFGIALLSRRPLASAASIDDEPYGFPTILARFDVGEQTVTLVGTHPMIPLGARNYDVRNTHLDTVSTLLMKAGGPRIFAGDLNATMWDRHYEALENRTWLRNVRRGFGVLPTWPTFMPPAMIPIDHVLVSEEFGVLDVHTGARIGSDHLPLVVTLSL